ncbi:hypothetical protein PS467_23945 [Streptomyces luomodiensis]|uniref:Aromatic ring-opening dioxygenase LigA n=1 Tax=Streptomyces luomodiensis TaxID=3026192 RepID=A0ABY9V064_9ACTN|nr:hypothetical protein [Streptomyces sp. SCA4-21]WNE98158.1 hypothetical protein PS467_23945 [Streptomyces sp. SCA4-21]
MTHPVNRAILLFDIERYSDRDDVEQAYLRRMLYDIADRTLAAAGVEETRRLRADRGDSVMELIDADASPIALLRSLLTEAPAQLRTINRMASSSAQIRLRSVLATGFVAVDDQGGWVGSDLNHACRLLDAKLLRAALRERTNDFALCVSESIHQGIVRHGHPGIAPEEFHPVTLESKNGPLGAWLHGPLPGGTASPDAAPESAPAPAAGSAPAAGPASQGPGATFHFSGGAPSFGGSLVAGDQHGVSGGTVHGDVHLGGADQGGTR